MGCIPAPLCRKALADATTSFPTRARGSDGICGDAAHQARPSDHNSGNAFDLTHDPKAGCDAHGFADQVRKQNPPWIKYIISKGRIWSKERNSQGWRDYNGSNPHNVHAHFSINSNYRNDAPIFPWTKGASTGPTEEEELMAAKDEILKHVTVTSAYQAQSHRVINIYGQLHRFEVNEAGDLRHQFFDPTVANADGSKGKWFAETWAQGCDPEGAIDVIPDYNGSMHVFVDHDDLTKVAHVWYSQKAGRASELIPR